MSDELTRSREAITPEPTPEKGPRTLTSRVGRVLLAAAGWMATGLAIAGVVLPILPTTPFLLVATACFAHSSPRLHAALLAHPRLGPYLVQWRRDRSIPVGAKRKAILLVVISFSLSIVLSSSPLVRLVLGFVGLAVIAIVGRLRTT